MSGYTMEYSEARGTWNIIDTINHEWYAEGTFEQMCAMMDNMVDDCEEDGFYEEPYPYEECGYYGEENVEVY